MSLFDSKGGRRASPFAAPPRLASTAACAGLHSARIDVAQVGPVSAAGVVNLIGLARLFRADLLVRRQRFRIGWLAAVRAQRHGIMFPGVLEFLDVGFRMNCVPHAQYLSRGRSKTAGPKGQ